MQRKVWKYPLKVQDAAQNLMVPHGGKIVHVANQNNTPTLWIEVNSNHVDEQRTFRMFGTGHPIEPAFWEHVGSCIITPFVWHIYEWKVRE